MWPVLLFLWPDNLAREREVEQSKITSFNCIVLELTRDSDIYYYCCCYSLVESLGSLVMLVAAVAFELCVAVRGLTVVASPAEERVATGRRSEGSSVVSTVEWPVGVGAGGCFGDWEDGDKAV